MDPNSLLCKKYYQILDTKKIYKDILKQQKLKAETVDINIGKLRQFGDIGALNEKVFPKLKQDFNTDYQMKLLEASVYEIDALQKVLAEKNNSVGLTD